MNKVFRTVFFATLFLTGVGLLQVHAQQNHFVYLQSDDKQPFTAVINGKTFKASSIGYVIIPKLTDGRYPLVISFPNKKFPDQQFGFDVNKTDIGFALKNYGAKGWGLFNLQSLEITMAGEEAKNVAKANGFGDMLSNAVNDTSLNVPPPVKEPAKEATVVKDVASDAPPAIAEQVAIITVPKTETVAENIPVSIAPAAATKKKGTKAPVTDNIAVQKIAEQTTDEGINMVFVEKSATGKDTVTIVLPKPKETQPKNTDSAIVEKAVTNLVSADTGKLNPVMQKAEEINMPDTVAGSQLNNPFFNSKEEAVAAKISTMDTATTTVESKVEQNNPVAAEPAITVAKHDCKTMLADNDFEKLRKKLFSTTGNDKMIQVAQKYMEDKCVTAAQVKTLSGNFLSDEARFDFFSAAYPHVSDTAEFSSLQSQLIDPLYKKRFQAMLK